MNILEAFMHENEFIKKQMKLAVSLIIYHTIVFLMLFKVIFDA